MKRTIPEPWGRKKYPHTLFGQAATFLAYFFNYWLLNKIQISSFENLFDILKLVSKKLVIKIGWLIDRFELIII